MLDRRFFRPKPVMQLRDHLNQYTHNLGLDVWNNDLVIAAGQDCKVRIWSISSGSSQPLVFGQAESLSQRTFLAPVTALAFERDKSKPTLWLADGCELYRFAIDH